MDPIRREQRAKTVRAPWSSREQPLVHEDTAHVVSDAGGLESASVERHTALGCGCLGKPPAGFCGLCEQPVCGDCFCHCQRHGCGRPLCRRHAMQLAGPDGSVLNVCTFCHEESTRERFVRRVGQFLLSPFFKFGGRS